MITYLHPTVPYCCSSSDSLKLNVFIFIFINTHPSFSSSSTLTCLSITFITQVLSLTSCRICRLPASSPAMALQNDAVTAMTNRSLRTVQSVSLRTIIQLPPHIVPHLSKKENKPMNTILIVPGAGIPFRFISHFPSATVIDPLPTLQRSSESTRSSFTTNTADSGCGGGPELGPLLPTREPIRCSQLKREESRC